MKRTAETPDVFLKGLAGSHPEVCRRKAILDFVRNGGGLMFVGEGCGTGSIGYLILDPLGTTIDGCPVASPEAESFTVKVYPRGPFKSNSWQRRTG